MPGDPSIPIPDHSPLQQWQKGLQKYLHALDPYTSAGPGTLPTCFLKEVACQIAPALMLVFQASLQQGRVQEDW